MSRGIYKAGSTVIGSFSSISFPSEGVLAIHFFDEVFSSRNLMVCFRDTRMPSVRTRKVTTENSGGNDWNYAVSILEENYHIDHIIKVKLNVCDQVNGEEFFPTQSLD